MTDEVIFTCPHCEQSLEAPPNMAGDTLACPSCQKHMTIPTPKKTPSKARPKRPQHHPPKSARKPAQGVKCQQCGSSMVKTKKAFRNLGLQVAGLLVFLLGIGLLFAFPIGTFFGIVLMIAAARMGYKEKKIWKCPKCGHFFEIA